MEEYLISTHPYTDPAIHRSGSKGPHEVAASDFVTSRHTNGQWSTKKSLQSMRSVPTEEVQGISTPTGLAAAAHEDISAMALVLAVDVEQTMPSVSSGSGRNRTTRCTQKGTVRSQMLCFRPITLTTFSYVELLEQQQAQLVHGLQELYRRTQTGQGWLGTPLPGSEGGHPLTHDILERLGAFKSDRRGERESFEEDVNILQQMLIEDGSGFLQQQESADSDSEHGQTPVPFLDLPSLTPSSFNNPFSFSQLLPTPPMESADLRSNCTSLTNPPTSPISPTETTQVDTRTSMDLAALRGQDWATPIIYEENMDLFQQLEVPTMCQDISGDYPRQLMTMNTINPRMAASEWNEDDFSAFLNPTIMA